MSKLREIYLNNEQVDLCNTHHKRNSEDFCVAMAIYGFKNEYRSLYREVDPTESSRLEVLERENKMMRDLLVSTADVIMTARTACDHLATRDPGLNSFVIHKTNIDSFKECEQKIEQLQIELFKVGNFKNGVFEFYDLKAINKDGS